MDKKLTMKDLEECFNSAKEESIPYVAVHVATRGSEGLEIIINPYVNFDSKLEYYKKAYTDDLVLKSYDGIRIVKVQHLRCIACM